MAQTMCKELTYLNKKNVSIKVLRHEKELSAFRYTTASNKLITGTKFDMRFCSMTQEHLPKLLMNAITPYIQWIKLLKKEKKKNNILAQPKKYLLVFFVQH